MATKAELQALLERVEAKAEPDRELDADLDVNLFGGEIVWRQANYTMEMYPASRRPSDHYVGGYAHEHVPLYTASIDAALALVERVLPDWSWNAGNVGEDDMPMANVTEPIDPCRDFSASAPTVPLAILSALLRALISQADEVDA